MPDFNDIKDDIQFSGFSEDQQTAILTDLERVYSTTSGREMMDRGLAGEGLHYLNTNSQAVLQEFATATQEDPRFQNSTAVDLHGGNFAVTDSAHPRTLSGGRVYVNAYDAVDPATGKPEVYTDPAFAGRSSVAADADPIYSLSHDGEVFEIDPFYILVHETNHTAEDERDITGNNSAAGQYYTPSMIDTDRQSVIDAYEGLNESSTQVIMEELGIEPLRGSYLGTSLEGKTLGDDYGLGRDHDVGVTSNRVIDMTGHTAVDAVVLDGLTQDSLNKFGAPNRTDLLDQSFRMGDGNDTVHAFDGDDAVLPGGGDDRIFLGAGDDLAVAGWGNDSYDGGDANLNPASDHRSDTTQDWGVDAVDYTTLSSPFIAPNGISADGTTRDGISMTIDGDAVSVNKGQHYAPMIAEDVDVLHNIDIIRGSARDDLTDVISISGDRLIDGGDGVDTLNAPDNVTNNPTAGVFNGQPYEGYLEAEDGSRLHYNDYEEVEMPTPPAPVLGPVQEAENTTITIEDALEKMRDRSGEVEDGAAADAINSGAARAMMETLAVNGQTDFEVSRARMEGGPTEEVSEILRSAGERLHATELTHEAEATFERHQSEGQQHQRDTTHEVEAENYDIAL